MMDKFILYLQLEKKVMIKIARTKIYKKNQKSAAFIINTNFIH